MRERLSQLICTSAQQDSNFVVLSGDHGYALFDAIRKERPAQFLNVGVAEQGMIGYAAGLCRVGYRPLVYGLSAFVPIRVLEQIKIDLCLSNLPVTLLGDGAGVVYTTLGASHQCAEDIACLRPMPNLTIYSPCDEEELAICFKEASRSNSPVYIRIGKSDRPKVHTTALTSSAPHVVHASLAKNACIVATGSMVSVAADLGKKLGLTAISVPRIKPFDTEIGALISPYPLAFVLEEHSRYGGLSSCLAEYFCERGGVIPKLKTLSLKDQFAEKCGSYQFALSEHDLSDEQIEARVRAVLATPFADQS